MAQFSIESAHTPAECLQALDDILAQGKDMLNKYNWGLLVGGSSRLGSS